MKINKQLQTDVLVIGGGGAGLRSALAAAESGSKVIVTNKGPLAKSGITLTAAGGMQAPLLPEDSPERYFDDTVKFGYGLADQNLVKCLTEQACAQVKDAERFGAQFTQDNTGNISLSQFPGQSVARNLFLKNGGVGLVRSLSNACQSNENISILDDFFVTGLISSRSGDAAISGALGLNLKTGELTQITAKATIIATGGCQRLWEVNDCPSDATGDGILYAFRAGAKLVDMEMVLFYPSVIIWPPSLKGAFVHYEFLDQAILDGNVYDKDGQPVLPKPLPVRDEAMRIMAKAIDDGKGTEHGGLLWYVGSSPKGLVAVRKKLNLAQYNYIRMHGVDPSTDKIEVAPGAHYLMGGIAIDEQCRTTLPGLFAAPESAGNFDGANRLAGSGITAIQVFGAIAGENAHAWAANNDYCAPDPLSLEKEITRVSSRLAEYSDTKTPAPQLRSRLCTAVQKFAGVIRNSDGLRQLQQIVCAIQNELQTIKAPDRVIFNQQLIDLLQLEIMCETAQIVAASALLRQESRGHHFRSDFPQQNDKEWLRHTVIQQGEHEFIVSTKEIIRKPGL